MSFILNGGLAPSDPWSGFSGPSSITALALWLTWLRGRELPASILGLGVVGGFRIAASTEGLYGGVLTDSGGVETGFDESSLPGQK